MDVPVVLPVTALACVIAGALLAWFFAKGRIAAAEAAARSAAAVDLAIANERIRALETERSELEGEFDLTRADVKRHHDALDEARDQVAKLGERASRVPVLEAGLEKVGTERDAERREILRLTRKLAESEQALEAGAARVRLLEQAESGLQRQLDEITGKWQEAASSLAALGMELKAERAQAAEKLALMQQARDALTDQFKSLANDILEEKSRRFTEQNQTNLGQLLDPLRVKLQEFQGKVEEVYVQEGKDRSALAEQVRALTELNRTLSTDARNLTEALKGSSKTRGTWGELVLERILESSGLRKGEEYDTQQSHTLEDGRRSQPDVVLHLPEDRHLVIDAKVSLNAYEEAAAAEDDETRAAAIRRHLDSIRGHITGLSRKNYQQLYALKSLDFVLMFVPIEPAFMVAVTHDRDLFMEAWQKNVLLVSPSTLIFVVRTVAHLWRQEAQSRNAQEIAKRGAELYDRLTAFVLDMEKLGERLRQAQESYADARDKLSRNKGNVIRQAEMLRQLGVKPTKSLPAELVDAALEETASPQPDGLPADLSPLSGQAQAIDSAGV